MMILTLHSQRLILTPYSPDDLAITVEMFTDPEVVRYAGGVLSEAVIEQRMPTWIKRGGNGCIGMWSVSDRETGEKYGSVALLPMPIDEDDTDYSLVIPGKMPEGEIEIGFFLKRAAWGFGYATEASRRLLHFAFQESPLTEIVATFEYENLGSKKVLEKLGFSDHGTMWCYGEESPNYRITRDEWLKHLSIE